MTDEPTVPAGYVWCGQMYLGDGPGKPTTLDNGEQVDVPCCVLPFGHQPHEDHEHVSASLGSIRWTVPLVEGDLERIHEQLAALEESAAQLAALEESAAQLAALEESAAPDP